MLTNAPLEPPALGPPVHDVRPCLALQSMRVWLSNTSANERAGMGAAPTLPDELDIARLFVIEVPDMKTPQCSQIVSPHDALEEPIPMNDHA
jgi:hypothetical protein